MALRVALINGSNLERDNDFGEILGSIFQSGAVVSGLQVQNTGFVSAGTAFIKCTRTATSPNETVWVIVKNPSDLAVSVSGTKKVWIEIPIANINNPLLNTDEGGMGIATLGTGTSYPSSNYIPLASISSGVITDERTFLRLNPIQRKNLNAWSVIYTNSAGEETLLPLGANSSVLFSNGESIAPSFLPIASLGLTGEMKYMATDATPTGWLSCKGQAVSRITYASLFSVLVPNRGVVTFVGGTPGTVNIGGHLMNIGDQFYFTTLGTLPSGLTANTLYFVSATGFTTSSFQVATSRGGASIAFTGTGTNVSYLMRCPWGNGDGTTTFNLPQNGRVLLSQDTTQAEFQSLGQTGGEKTHTLTEAELPAHAHTYTEVYNTSAWPIEGTQWPYSQGYRTSNTSSIGSSSAHNNLPPYAIANLIIKT